MSNEYFYAYDPEIQRRCTWVKKGNYGISLASGKKVLLKKMGLEK